MADFYIENGANTGFTPVSDNFIKTYMKNMSGGYLKVYLYLLMISKQNTHSCIEDLTGFFETTGKDITETLKALSSLGLIDLYFKNGEISGLKIVQLPQMMKKADSELVQMEAVQADSTGVSQRYNEPVQADSTGISQKYNEPVHMEPATIAYYSDGKTKFVEPSLVVAKPKKTDKEIGDCMNCIGLLIGTTLSQSHFNFISFLMNDLDFSVELVTTLYEVAKERNKMNLNYLNTVALDWHSSGIKTPQEAKNEASMHSGLFKTIATAFGLDRNLAPAEIQIVNEWKKYDFDNTIIKEACSRTILQSHGVNLHYTSKILKEWFDNGVKSLNDISEIDKTFHKNKNAVNTPSNGYNAPKNRFQNHPERNYSASEESEIEKKLLNRH